VGDRIVVAARIAGSSADDPLAGVQGSVHFDAASLKFLGQIAEPPTLAMAGDAKASQGVIRIMSVNARGLPPRWALLVFRVVGPGYLRGLRFDGSLAVTQKLSPMTLTTSGEFVRTSG
jgi:hypothetical protein